MNKIVEVSAHAVRDNKVFAIFYRNAYRGYAIKNGSASMGRLQDAVRRTGCVRVWNISVFGWTWIRNGDNS